MLVFLVCCVLLLDGCVLWCLVRLWDFVLDWIVMLRNVIDLDLCLLCIFVCVVKCGGFIVV